MNYRSFVHSRPLHFLMKSRHGLLMLLTCLLLAACWGGDEAEPATTGEPAAEAPQSALPTAAAPTSTTVALLPTETVSAATPRGIAAVLPTSSTTNAVVTATMPAADATPPLTPLVEGADCEIESNLDLVGYPDLEQRMGCASEAAIFDPIAINEFGDAQPTDRFMLWFSHEGLIYVLKPDGTYETFEDTWAESEPTYPCNPLGGEEDSPPLPRRGFGKLWCNNPEIQEIMGAVPREERLCQYSVLQRFQNGRLLACFEDATIRYFRILDDGTWDLQIQ